MIVHIEMYDGKAFCGSLEREVYNGVLQGDWHYDSTAIRKVTCRRCLAKICEMGEVASTRLEELPCG